MKKKAIRLACAVTVGSMLAACGLLQRTDVSPASIKNYTWVLSSVNGEASTNGKRVTINFEPTSNDSGRISGSAQCNNYFGEYSTDSDTITFGTVGSTMMACEPAAMEQELIYIGSFATIDSIKLKGHELILSGGKNKFSFFAEAAKVNGDINFKGTMPAGTELVVRLQDTSRADAPAITISEKVIKLEQPTTGPVAFSLNYAPQLLKDNRNYSLSIQAHKDGNLLYTNTSRIDVSFDKLADVTIEKN